VTFFLDHDVPRHLADVLRRHGHEVELVSDVMSPEADDEKVFCLRSKNEGNHAYLQPE
jgi:predicted nuclease of predicted toxin-antitoxin system